MKMDFYREWSRITVWNSNSGVNGCPHFLQLPCLVRGRVAGSPMEKLRADLIQGVLATIRSTIFRVTAWYLKIPGLI